MKCSLCPNNCNIDREKNLGVCKVSSKLKIAKYAPFFYEEPPISGKFGSGAIFFCGCSLLCRFCQNYELSRNLRGKEISNDEFQEIISNLISLKVHNINLVNPSHYLDSLYEFFKDNKPSVPIVYNTHGYEKISSLKKAENFVDIYLTDLKYFSPTRSARYCGKSDYFDYASKAILEMVKQKPLSLDNDIMKRGVVVRHLVLPQNIDESLTLIDWFSDNIGNIAYLSIMSQYTPFGDIKGYPELNRKLTQREIDRVNEKIYSRNLSQVFVQEKESANKFYIPEWDF